MYARYSDTSYFEKVLEITKKGFLTSEHYVRLFLI